MHSTVKMEWGGGINGWLVDYNAFDKYLLKLKRLYELSLIIKILLSNMQLMIIRKSDWLPCNVVSICIINVYRPVSYSIISAVKSLKY